ncbi:MAG TPA: hypothetical protein VJ246_01870 [Patescibacteria group bacterium]|nr:hypothetical protein [Patescibacteria group bacterium]
MSYLETARTAIAKVSANLSHLPELQKTVEIVQGKAVEGDAFTENPSRYIRHTYIQYLRIIKDLATLKPEEVELIRTANTRSAERGISTNSASHGGADYFLDILGTEKQQKVLGAVLESANAQSNIFQTALEDLSARMTRGHELAEVGAQISDGASADADFAIWGHTKGLTPEAMVHFVLCHFLERTFTAQFIHDQDEDIRELVSRKDTLLAAMGDVIRLRNAQGVADPYIVTMWEKDRDQGGLKWNRQSRQELYNEVVSEK